MVRRPYPVIVEARARRWTAPRSGTVADMVGSAGSADSIRLPVRDVRARWRNPEGAFVDNRSWDGPCHHRRYLGSRGHTDPGTALAPPRRDWAAPPRRCAIAFGGQRRGGGPALRGCTTGERPQRCE